MVRARENDRVTRAISSLQASATSAFRAGRDMGSEPAKPCYLKRLPNEVIRRILHYLDHPNRLNASATAIDFFCNSDSLVFIADVPKFPIVRRCDPRPEDGIRERKLDKESSQRHRIFDALLEPGRAENLKSFTILQRTEVPIAETALNPGRQRLKAAVFRDYARLQTLQLLYQLSSSASKLEHLHVGFPLPARVLHLVAERCQSLRSLAIPLQAGFDISPFHALKSLVILHADLECISLGGSNGVVGLFLGQLDMLAVHIKGYPEPARWPRQLWTRISLDGFPKLQHVSIFSAGPFSPHSIFHGSAASVQTLVVDGPFEFHYAMQLRAFCRQFRHTKSLSVRNLRLWYNPVFQQVNTLSQLDSLEIVEVDPRYFISDSLKLTQFRMSTAAGLDDLGGVVDMLAPSLQQQKLQTLSLCLPGRLPLDATFVNLIASTNVTLKHLQLIGKKLITYEDRWQLLRNRLIPSLDTAHIQGGWLPAQMQPKALCGIPQAGDDIFHQNRRTPVLECPKELTAEYFNRRFIENADPLGYFAFAWGARSYTLSVGEDENHIRHAMETMPVFEQMGVRLDSPASTLLPPAVTSALPYGVQYDFHDPMELT